MYLVEGKGGKSRVFEALCLRERNALFVGYGHRIPVRKDIPQVVITRPEITYTDIDALKNHLTQLFSDISENESVNHVFLYGNFKPEEEETIWLIKQNFSLDVSITVQTDSENVIVISWN